MILKEDPKLTPLSNFIVLFASFFVSLSVAYHILVLVQFDRSLQAAELNSARDQMIIAMMYDEGMGSIELDRRKALDWYIRTSETLGTHSLGSRVCTAKTPDGQPRYPLTNIEQSEWCDTK